MTDDVRLAIREAIKDAARAKSNNDYGLFLDDVAERIVVVLQEVGWRHVPEEGGPENPVKNFEDFFIWKRGVEAMRMWLLGQKPK